MSKIYLLSNQKYQGVENLEVFKIDYLCSKVDFSKYEALIFTSKNAIYSLDSFNKFWREIPSYAIAKKTANIIKQYNGNLVFTGKTSHGDEFAKELIPKLKDKKVLYIKALKTVSSLQNILKNASIQLDELVTYKTSFNKVNKKLEKNSVFIFTSPSSVEYFFKQFSWDETYKAIVIGNTTAKFMPQNIKYTLSNKTSIKECIKIAQKLLF